MSGQKPKARAQTAPAGPGIVAEPEDALVALQKARDTALAGGDPLAISTATREYLANLLIRLAKVETISGNQSASDDCYAKALALLDSPSVRLEYGSYLLGTGRAEQALAQLTSVTTGELSRNPNAWIAQALAYRAQGNNDEAARSFEQALRLKQDINIAYALGSVLLLSHQEKKAASLFQQIFTLDGKEAIWHVAVGDAYRDAHYFNEALEEFRKAIAIDQKALHAEFFLGLTYLQMNEWGPSPDSFDHLRKAVALSPHEYISNFYLGALESTDGNDLASSDRHLRAAAVADPSQPEVWIYLGQNANREHDDVAAEKDFRKAVELTGTNESINNYQIRRAYSALGRLLSSQGKKEEAAVFLAKYRATEKASLAASSSKIASMGAESGIDPSSAAAPAVIQGVALPTSQVRAKGPQLTLAQKKELDAQSSALKHLVAEGYNDLGTAQARQQDYATALQTFLLAEQWESPSTTLLRNVGLAAFRVSNFSEASRALSQYVHAESANRPASKDSPAMQRAGLMLGLSYFNQGKFKEAAVAFDGVSQAAMADSRAAYSWAFSLARTGHAQEANHIADQLQMQSLPPDELSLVCHIYMDDENYEGGLSCFRKAYQQDSTLQLAHYEAGQALIHLDRPQEAIAEIEQEEKLAPNNPNVQYSLAYALLQASRKDEASTMLQRITAEHPENSEAQYQLGKLLLEQGKTGDAVAHLEASEKASAAPDYVHYQLGIAYKKAGRQSDADRELKLYREMKDKKREDSSASVPQTH